LDIEHKSVKKTVPAHVHKFLPMKATSTILKVTRGLDNNMLYSYWYHVLEMVRFVVPTQVSVTLPLLILVFAVTTTDC